MGPTRAGHETISVPPGQMLTVSLSCGLEISAECVAEAGEALPDVEDEAVERVSAAGVAASGEHELELEEGPDILIHHSFFDFASISPLPLRRIFLLSSS